MTRTEFMILFNRQVLQHMINRPLKGGLSNWETGVLQHQRAVTLRGFLLSRLESNAVRRWLFLKEPCNMSKPEQGRWAKSRAGWLKQVWAMRCDGMAPESIKQERTVFTYGKSLLCSRIHQKA